MRPFRKVKTFVKLLYHNSPDTKYLVALNQNVMIGSSLHIRQFKISLCRHSVEVLPNTKEIKFVTTIFTKCYQKMSSHNRKTNQKECL